MEQSSCASWDPALKAADAPAGGVERLVDRAIATALASREGPPQSLPLPIDRMAVTDADGTIRHVDVLA
jgi:hypothetical protein